MNDGSLRDTIDSISDDPCHDCGRALGMQWTERYDEATGRMWKVHHAC